MICFTDQDALDAYVAKRMAEKDRCPFVWVVDLEGQPLWIQCVRMPGHSGDHFHGTPGNQQWSHPS